MKFTRIICFIMALCLIFCFSGCGKNETSDNQASDSQTEESVNLCAKGHKGCFQCEVCGEDFIEDFEIFVDKNKSSNGFIPITGYNFYGAIQTTEDYPIYMILTIDESDVFSETIILAYKKAYSSSKWLYIYQMKKDAVAFAEITGAFATLDDGNYLPYGSGDSKLKNAAYECYTSLIEEVQKVFNEKNSGLIVQYFGLNI